MGGVELGAPVISTIRTTMIVSKASEGLQSQIEASFNESGKTPFAIKRKIDALCNGRRVLGAAG
jgi:hypothetical protein